MSNAPDGSGGPKKKKHPGGGADPTYWELQAFEYKYGHPAHGPADMREAAGMTRLAGEMEQYANRHGSIQGFHPHPGGGNGGGGGSGDRGAGGDGNANGAGGSHQNSGGGSNVAVIVDFFRGKGLSDAAIAGILGNLRVESSFSPTAYNGGEGAHGIAQWEGSRWPALQQFASSHGGNPYDLQTQLEFMWHELNTGYSGVLQTLRSTNSAYQAGMAFAQNYEGCDSSTWNERANNAVTYLNNGLRGIGGESSQQSGTGPGADGSGAGHGPGSNRAGYRGVDGLGDLLQQVPELRHLLQQAQAGDWSVAKFQNEVENSRWYQNHSASAREVLIEQANDPATYAQSLNQTLDQLNSLSGQLGMPLTAQEAHAIATSALLSGNSANTQWLTEQIGQKQNYHGLDSTNGLEGGMAATVQQLEQLAAAYGQKADPATLAMHAKAILTGQQTLDTFRQAFMDRAISAFPGLADQLKAGQTVSDIAQPYIQSMSQLLEINPSQVDLFTPLVRRALQGTQTQGGRQTTPQQVPLWQFENQVRQDPRWQYTSNAKQAAASTALYLGGQWGFDG